MIKKMASIVILGFSLLMMAIAFQNCSSHNTSFEPSSGGSSHQASSEAQDSEPLYDDYSGGACVSQAGQACIEKVPACLDHLGCTDVLNIYYNSPNGCDPATAEYFHEGTYDKVSDSWITVAKHSPSAPVTREVHKEWRERQTLRCHYVGFSSTYIPEAIYLKHVRPNGVCTAVPGFIGNNTYVKVKAGKNCSSLTDKYVPKPFEFAGTVQCDGTCKIN